MISFLTRVIDINADINSTLTIAGTASVSSFGIILQSTQIPGIKGVIDSGTKTVFEVGIPGLDFPGYARLLIATLALSH
jgi:hypothetical protein